LLAPALIDVTGIFKMFMNAIRKGKTMLADAVMDPVMVRRKTGRYAKKKVAIFELLPRQRTAREYAILLSTPQR
jgi:hypothetical protein